MVSFDSNEYVSRYIIHDILLPKLCLCAAYTFHRLLSLLLRWRTQGASFQFFHMLSLVGRHLFLLLLDGQLHLQTCCICKLPFVCERNTRKEIIEFSYYSFFQSLIQMVPHNSECVPYCPILATCPAHRNPLDFTVMSVPVLLCKSRWSLLYDSPCFP